MSEANTIPQPITLAAGDVLDISFPGAPNLTGQRRIGPEGAISMPIVGQVQAAGKTVTQLQSELENLYANQLQDKQIVVTLASSSNVIYVTGSVARPGRVVMDRPLTALEAALESGGFAADANLKKVTVFRYEDGQNVTYLINLEPVYEGGPVSPFYLKPRDVVNVPKKIQWF